MTTTAAIPAPTTPNEFKALSLVEMRAYLETKPRAPQRITDIYSGLCRWTDTMWPLCVFLYERDVAYMDVALEVYREEVHRSPFFWECVGSVIGNATKLDKPILALILRRTRPHYAALARIDVVPFARRRASVHWRKKRSEIFDFYQELALPPAFYEARLSECVRMLDRHEQQHGRVPGWSEPEHAIILERKLVPETGPFAHRMLEKTIVIDHPDAARIAAYFYEEQLDDEFIDIMMTRTPLTRAKVDYFRYQYFSADLRALLMSSRWWFVNFNRWLMGASDLTKNLMPALCEAAQLDCSRAYAINIRNRDGDAAAATNESPGMWHASEALFRDGVMVPHVRVAAYEMLFVRGVCPLRNAQIPDGAQSISNWLVEPPFTQRALNPQVFVCLFAAGDIFTNFTQFRALCGAYRAYGTQVFTSLPYTPGDVIGIMLAGVLLNGGDVALKQFHDEVCPKRCTGRVAMRACAERRLYEETYIAVPQQWQPLPRPDAEKLMLDKRAELAQRQWRTQARQRALEIAVALRKLALPDLVVYKIINKSLPWLSAKCVPMHKKYKIAKLVHDARVGGSREQFVEQLHAQKRALKMQ